MTDAQGVKESVAARLEDMGVVHVTDIRDDGYGEQLKIAEPKRADADPWGDFTETKKMYERLMRGKGGTGA